MIHPLKRRISFLSTLAIGVAMLGCESGVTALTASFAPGSGNSLGVLSYGSETFDIQTDNSGNVSRVVSNTGGSFDVDDTGNISNITTADGSMLDLNRNSDGSYDAILMDSELGTLNFDIPAGAIPTAKGFGDRAGVNISCGDISLLCQTARFIIEFFLTDIVDEIVAEAVAQTGLPEFLVRPTVQAKIDGYVKLIQDFCDGWDMLLADEGCPL